MVCNPCGYVTAAGFENQAWNPGLVIEVESRVGGEPMLLGDVVRPVVDALSDPGEAISVEVARAMLQGFGETRH